MKKEIFNRFKEWFWRGPFWLKGGITGVGINILLLLLSIVPPFIAIIIALFPYLILVEIFGFTFLESGLDVFNIPNIYGLIVNFAAWFLLGSIGGVIIGNVRSA